MRDGALKIDGEVATHLRVASVVIDTTAFYANYDLKGVEWGQLFALATALPSLNIMVPHVVIRETARHYRREATQVDRSAISALSDALKQLGKVTSVPELNIRTVREELRSRREAYESGLRETLVERGARIAPIPEMSTSLLVDWAIEERQPFKDSGEGFRDALIWGTVLECVRSDEAPDLIIFVSGNTRDFGGPDGSLAAPLVADVAALETGCEVQLVADLRGALEILSPEAAFVRSEREAFASLTPSVAEIFAFDPEDLLANSIADATDKLMGSVLASPGNSRVLNVTSASGRVVSLIVSVPADLRNASIYDIEAIPTTLTWTEQDRYADRLLGEASVEADLIIDGTVPSDIYEDVCEAWDPYFTEDDFDPDEMPSRQIWIGLRVLVRLRYRAAIDANLDSVEDLELETVEAVLETGSSR